MKLAIDFDGTIVEHRYPEIGREMLFAFDTLKALQQQGHQLILWTYRTGRELDDAVDYCRKNGIEFYAINNSYPEEVFNNNFASRKIMADVFIDDKNIGGFPGWGVIWNMLNPSTAFSPENERRVLNERKPSFWSRFFNTL
jgi:hypothetical protein